MFVIIFRVVVERVDSTILATPSATLESKLLLHTEYLYTIHRSEVLSGVRFREQLPSN